MADGLQETVINEILRPLINFWASRDDRKALSEAGKLRFWGDGMLNELKAISDGRATEETFELLKKKFFESEGSVGEAMKKLREARNKLGGGPIAKSIDSIIASDGYGKGFIRHLIGEVLAYRNDPDGKHAAQSACNTIEAFNAALDRLYRLVEEYA